MPKKKTDPSQPTESPRRPTQRDIAQRAGVTQATVSLAMSNHPGISEETRTQVLQAAEALGYVPDPYLSGLSAYRKRIRSANFQGTLAWISNYPPNESWRRWPLFYSYFEGARDRAKSLGYNLEEHLLQGNGMTKARLRKILMARNIRGLLIAPQPAPEMRMDFDFSGFASVTFGYSLVEPELHVVTMQQFRSMEIVFRKLVALGYRRPGLAMPVNSDQRSDRNWSAAFWSEQRTLPEADRIPLLLPEALHTDSLRQWIDQYKPDVVVSISRGAYDQILQSGLRVPEDIGVALVSVPDQGDQFTGIWENPQFTGARGVELLIDLIHRGDFGVPDVRLFMLVGGSWKEGQTTVRQV